MSKKTLPCGLTLNEIIADLNADLKSALEVERDRTERMYGPNRDTDETDCFRSIKSTNDRISRLNANLELAENDFKVTFDVEQITYKHPDFNVGGILRNGEYGEYVMFIENDKVLFINPHAKTKRGLKGLIKEVTIETITTLGEYITAYNPHNLVGGGYNRLYTLWDNEHNYNQDYAEQCNYIFYDDTADQMEADMKRQEELNAMYY